MKGKEWGELWEEWFSWIWKWSNGEVKSGWSGEFSRVGSELKGNFEFDRWFEEWRVEFEKGGD